MSLAHTNFSDLLVRVTEILMVLPTTKVCSGAGAPLPRPKLF